MNIDEQVALLMQGTEYGDAELKKSMGNELRERLIAAEEEGRPLRIYCGYDPTSADLHLGHTITMRKMRQFQDLGHEVVFLIGNFTSLVGDPSDKDKLRPKLTPEQIKINGETYAEQAYRILDREKTQVRYNADWLSEIDFGQLIHLASNFTVGQFLARENFKKRFDKGEAIYLHEFFYAIMQAYDAFSLKTDVQIGGTDQLFNIITAGRKLMGALGEKPNIGIIMKILPGTDGEIKMSKSTGNHIPLNTDAVDMYGKIMSVPDKAMPDFFKLVTRWSVEEVNDKTERLVSGETHPRDAKMALAFEIVDVFYGADEAKRSQQAFIQVVQKGNLPDEIPTYALQPGQTVLEVMEDGGLISSRSEGRRLLKQNGVSFDGEKITDPFAEFPGKGVLKVGKRRFLKVE